MNEVYLGIFSRGAAGEPVAMSAEVLHGHEIINDLAVSGAAARIAAGQGWQRYPKLMAINKQHFYGESDVLYPRGRFLLTLGATALAQGDFLLPQDIAPAYLRNKVAEKPAA